MNIYFIYQDDNISCNYNSPFVYQGEDIKCRQQSKHANTQSSGTKQSLTYQGTILETLLCQYVKLYYVNRWFFTPVIVIQIPILSPNM